MNSSTRKLINILIMASTIALLGNGVYFVPSQVSQQLGVAVGVHLRPRQIGTTDGIGWSLKQFNTAMQKDAAILMHFLPWNGAPGVDQVFDEYNMWSIDDFFTLDQRPAIMLTWSPMIISSLSIDYTELGLCNSNLINGKTIPMANIINGLCDNYIRVFARDIGDRPERFLIRFAHEMNISDTPWYPPNQGLAPADYIAMYRRVYDVYTSEQNLTGKHNGEWVWSPNYASNPYVEWNSYYHYYPGDNYVDWIGLSGYNWNDGRSFTQIYGDVDGSGAYMPPGVLNDMACRFRKPQILAEIGVASSVTYKANWISDMFNRAPQFPFLRAIVWFNDYAFANTSADDFRVYDADGANDPSTAPVNTSITTQYRTSLSPTTFTSTLPTLEEATPQNTYCGGGLPEYRVTSVLMLEPGESGDIFISGINIPEDQTINVLANDPLSASDVPLNLTSPWDVQSFQINATSSASLTTYQVSLDIDEENFPIQVIVTDQIKRIFLPIIQN